MTVASDGEGRVFVAWEDELKGGRLLYATSSKDNPSPPIGVDGLRVIVAALRARRRDLPVCAIAGIDATNAAPVISAGANGIAVISALSMNPDPQAAARELRAIVDAALAAR